MTAPHLTRTPDTRPPPAPGRARRRGAALVIGLLILTIMTIVGLSAMRGTTLEERMSGNLKESNDAIQAAEAALQAAVSAIFASPLPPRPGAWGTGSIDGACKVAESDSACILKTNIGSDWLSANAMESLTGGAPFASYAGANFGHTGTPQPRIIVRFHRVLPPDGGTGTYFYTVSAVAADPGGESRRVLQTTIAKSY
jgi:Tfp pilus assembly protein PilX